VTTVQDYTLFHLLGERSIDLWKNQINLILEKNGLASFIVHPDYLLQADTRRVYEQLLDHLRGLREEAGVWCASPEDVNSWWRMRNLMSLEKKGNSWKILGDQTKRARVAYARNANGSIVYELAGTSEPAAKASATR